VSAERKTGTKKRPRKKDPVLLNQLLDWSRQSEDVKLMIRLVGQAEGATSAHHLLDVNRDAFDQLYEAAEALITQLGAD
jgi:hypothetical protein